MFKISLAACLVLLTNAPAQAQLMNMLQNATGASASGSGSSGSGLSGLGGLANLGGGGASALGGSSPTNLAGVLQYCVQNNYLGASNPSTSPAAASSVQSALLDKFTGSSTAPSSNSSYTAGANGQLNTGNGNNIALGGTGLKAQITQKLCNEVLTHAKSLL